MNLVWFHRCFLVAAGLLLIVLIWWLPASGGLASGVLAVIAWLAAIASLGALVLYARGRVVGTTPEGVS